MATEKKLYYGKTDLPLTASGVEGIALLRKQGIYPEGGIFFTSGLLRAEQTFNIIYGNMRRRVIPLIAELNVGEFEMKSYDELKDRADYQAWITDETGDVACPGGESVNQFRSRIMEGYNRIISEVRESMSAIAVCHGGVIALIMEHLYPGEKNFYEWVPETGRGYTIAYDSDGLHEYEPI
ncbi:MAG: histidine phosphatase family protein [Oscillospiraceae bacterium]|nr:histidine phosphatase family protein [Oscillospiraceae bacterium]